MDNVIAGQGWRKASISNSQGACAEVATEIDGGEVVYTVRDSKLGDGSPVLRFTRAEWDAFLDGAARGEFTPDERGLLPEVAAS